MAQVLIYDGDCGFCTSAAQWISARWASPGTRSVPWQFLTEAELAAMGLTSELAAQRVYWWDTTTLVGGERAIAAALRAAPFPWRPIGTMIDSPPVRLVARPVYQLVAKYRHRLPGGTPACRSDLRNTDVRDH